MKLALPVETINATLEYLASRPYREVMHLIPAIQAAEPVQDSRTESQTEVAADADAEHHAG